MGAVRRERRNAGLRRDTKMMVKPNVIIQLETVQNFVRDAFSYAIGKLRQDANPRPEINES